MGHPRLCDLRRRPVWSQGRPPAHGQLVSSVPAFFPAERDALPLAVRLIALWATRSASTITVVSLDAEKLDRLETAHL